MDYKAIGLRIKQGRGCVNISQEKLSEILNISTEHLCRIENGTARPSLQLIERISDALHLSEQELMFGTRDASLSGLSARIDLLSPEEIKILNALIDMITK